MRVYSNCAEVELNSEWEVASARRRKDRVNVCRWENVALQPGANRIEATGQSDGKTVSDRCEWVLEDAPGTN